MSISVYAPDATPAKDRPLYVCAHPPCSLALAPGRYQLYAGGSRKTVAGSREVTLSTPTTFVVDPDTKLHRAAGALIGAGGAISLFVGAAFLVSALCWDCSGAGTRAQAGFALMLGGLVATPVGWVMFGTSFRPKVETFTRESSWLSRLRTARLPTRFSLGFRF